MRLIGKFKNQTRAQVFSDYLYIRNIENRIEPVSGNIWEIWVFDEDQVAGAEKLLRDYLDNPDEQGYKKASQSAQEKRKQKEKEDKEYDKRQYTRQKIFSSLKGQSFQPGSVTGVLIICSVLVTLFLFLGINKSIISHLFITEFKIEGKYITWGRRLPEICHGQIWRLFTPIFLHFGLMHILFNMMWLKDLGSMIENRQGAIFFLIKVLVLAALSNFGQYLVSGPSFGGMSGVVYGLLGYIWMKGKHDPASGLFVSKHNVVMMIVWFFLCLTGIMGNIANTAHGIGLGVGIIWGYLSAKIRK